MRHVAHFDPNDKSVGTCTHAPESVLIAVEHILCAVVTKRESKKRVAEQAALASADRTVRKQIKIDVQCNSFGKDVVDNKLCRAFVSAGIPFATIDNSNMRAWSTARGLA